MSEQKAPAEEFAFWMKAALPWAIIHFGVFFTAAYVTNSNNAVVAIATWMVVVMSGAVHYAKGKRDGQLEASKGQPVR